MTTSGGVGSGGASTTNGGGGTANIEAVCFFPAQPQRVETAINAIAVEPGLLFMLRLIDRIDTRVTPLSARH